MAETTVYLSLGSNVGDREVNLRAAIAALPATGVRVTRVSSFYETEPVDFLEQEWFFCVGAVGGDCGGRLAPEFEKECDATSCGDFRSQYRTTS
jgi:hypothetical protein